jgi:hypothetical protein
MASMAVDWYFLSRRHANHQRLEIIAAGEPEFGNCSGI